MVEGEARRITDPTTVAAMAARWAAGGWPARVDESGQALTAEFSAPSAGPPPWFVYRLTPSSATALSTVEPGGATRWRTRLTHLDVAHGDAIAQPNVMSVQNM